MSEADITDMTIYVTITPLSMAVVIRSFDYQKQMEDSCLSCLTIIKFVKNRNKKIKHATDQL